MRQPTRLLSIVAALAALAGAADAADLSTSALHPTPVGASGVVDAAFPATKTTFYVAVPTKPGTLLTQTGYEGRRGANKAVDVSLLGDDGRRVDGYWIHGEEAAEEKTRSFAIDATATRTVRLEVEGPPTAKFRIAFGGSAVADVTPDTVPPTGLSRSVFAPTPVAADGVVTGKLPGPEKRAIHYVSVPVQPGDLLTQISVRSRDGADKSLSFELLGTDGRGDQNYWVHGGAATEEKTRSFPIDASGQQVIRLILEGPETGTFTVELGGSAVAPQKAADAGAVTGGHAGL